MILPFIRLFVPHGRKAVSEMSKILEVILSIVMCGITYVVSIPKGNKAGKITFWKPIAGMVNGRHDAEEQVTDPSTIYNLLLEAGPRFSRLAAWRAQYPHLLAWYSLLCESKINRAAFELANSEFWHLNTGDKEIGKRPIRFDRLEISVPVERSAKIWTQDCGYDETIYLMPQFLSGETIVLCGDGGYLDLFAMQDVHGVCWLNALVSFYDGLTCSTIFIRDVKASGITWKLFSDGE